MKEKRHITRWLLLAALPVALLVRGIWSVWRAFKGQEERILAPDRKVHPLAPYHRQRRVVQVGAGLPITATVFVPSGEGPFPAVVMVHSWMWWRMQCDLLYAPSFARRGYVVLTYDCRGWGSSGGEVSCAAPDRELEDLEDMISWLISPESGIPVDPEKIGITGVSYGGGHSFLAATRDPRIKAAAPMNGWTDLSFSLMPNGCWKAIWSIVLFIGSVWALKFNMKNDLVRWLKTVVKERDFTTIRGELEDRSAIHGVENVKCPMFIVHSWNDDLFEPNQILRFYEKLDCPKRIYITNGVHGFDAGRGDFLVSNFIWDDVRRWFDYWLKDERDNGVADEPAVKYYTPWDRKMVEADGWPPENSKKRTFYLRGEHPSALDSGSLVDDPPDDHEPAELLINNTVSNFHTSGFPILRLSTIDRLPVPGMPFSIPGDSVAFTSEPLERDAVMVGEPSVELFVTSSSQECQINAFLYDVSPRGFCRFVTHCASMKRGLEPDTVVKVEFDLIACAHKFLAGHRIRVVACASDPLYVFPSLTPAFYRLFHTADNPSSVTLPLLESAAS